MKKRIILIISLAIIVILAGLAIGTGLTGLIIVNKNADEYEKEGTAYKVIGNYFAEKGEFEEAIIAYKKSLIYKEDIEVRNNLALLYYEQARYTEAIEQLRELILIEPYNPSYHYDLAVNLVDKFRNSKEQTINDIIEALNEYEKAEELSPGIANAKENIEVLKRILKQE